MDEVVALDPDAHTVTVAAGMTYGQVVPYLHSKDFALHNLASFAPYFCRGILQHRHARFRRQEMATLRPRFLVWKSSPLTVT